MSLPTRSISGVSYIARDCRFYSGSIYVGSLGRSERIERTDIVSGRSSSSDIEDTLWFRESTSESISSKSDSNSSSILSSSMISPIGSYFVFDHYYTYDSSNDFVRSIIEYVARKNCILSTSS